jgi:hypothetical protein
MLLRLPHTPRLDSRNVGRGVRTIPVATGSVTFMPLQNPAQTRVLPQLYLHGLAQGDFDLPLRGLLGEGAPLSVCRSHGTPHSSPARSLGGTLCRASGHAVKGPDTKPLRYRGL